MSAPTDVLHEEHGLRYAIAREDSAPAVARLLSECFAREPMAAALGASVADLHALAMRFVAECTTNGLSVIATPIDDPATLAGVFISRDFKAPLPDGVPEQYPWFLPIATALMTVDEAYEVEHPGLEPGRAVDLWMVAVSSNPRFAKHGIAGTLFRLCVELARRNGFERCVTECTGHYSQTAARKNGFEERARLAYRDFRFEGQPVFAAIAPPHTHLILFERVI